MTHDTRVTAHPTLRHDTEDARNRRLGIALALISGVLFAVFPVVGRFATQYDVSKATQLGFRFLIGCLIVLPFALRQGPVRLTPLQWTGFAAMGGMYVIQSIFYLMSTDRIPIGMTSILLYLYPAVVAVLSRLFLGERLTRVKLLALALASVGAVLTIGAPGAVRDMTGVWMALVTPTVYSIYIIVGAKLQRGVPAQVSSATIMGSAAALAFGMGVLGPLIAPGSRLFTLQFDLPWQAWLALLAFGAVCTAPPVLTFLESVKHIGASQTSILSTIELVATALFGALFFAEALQPLQIAGGVLVIGAVVILTLSPAPRSPQHTA